ncbi:hypothetical protein GTR04_2715 [Trichophyton interdigitale]|uniref:Uncharacterized protein n=1 Tax=Trichophyton interdigitale TaxID=101480 RepID=A0A9P5CY76_9EURO|nr:hypothetical protein GY631_2582 [Trichophyton interdigitale]KAF3896907.1 hypothetical protein GY632_2557 [Trichophyton interdigitale]KAG8209913.1 hypothetical protein GTR04_2715 [Trichophyton interdigitale]
MAVFIQCLIEHQQDIPIPAYFVISFSRTAGRRGIFCKLDLHGINKQIVRIDFIKFTRLTVSAAAAAARAQAQAVNWAASLPSSATSRPLRSAKQATNALRAVNYELGGRSIDRSDLKGDIVPSVWPYRDIVPNRGNVQSLK